MFEMTDIQKALFGKLTSLQKEIALNSIAGMNDIDAYKASKGKAKTISAMESSASEILRNPEVDAFIASMVNTVVNPAIMSRDEMLAELSVIAGVVTPDLTENGIGSLTENRHGFDVKLKAIKQLAELAGYDAPIVSDLKSSDGSMSPRSMSDADLLKIAGG